MADIDREYVECTCSSAEHVIRFTHDPDDEVIYVETQLNLDQPFHKRLILAAKYLLGIHTNYHYAETVWELKEMQQVRNVLDIAIENAEKNAK